MLEKSKAAAIIVPQGFTHNGKTLIQVDHPLKSFSRILELIDEEMNPHIPGIHPLASIDSTAKIGSGVKIGPFCVIEKNAEIGDNVNLVAHVYIGHDSVIGKNTKIYPSVIVRENILIGSHCTIHAGTIIGSDGYGYYFSEGQHNKIHQVGKVIIEDNVEIGSCTTIDRATTGATLIKKGTKIDNLVQIAHNVEIGPHSLLVAQVGIAGSTKLGAGVVMGGQSGVADHLTIGNGAQIGGQAGVIQDVEAGEVLWGIPAQPIQSVLRQNILIKRLPELFKKVNELKEFIKK
jgi:UDP-3-O-[3-hydroxymyristoyl] glucosamine N-acyltransferase